MNLVQAPPPVLCKTAPQSSAVPQGLGGWLILVGIGLIISPVRIAIIDLTIFKLFLDGTWSAIANSSSEFYNQILAIMIPLEFVINLAFVFGFVFLIYLFFTKSCLFPRWFIAVYVANLLFILADAFLVNMAVPEQPIFDPDTVNELIRSFVACAVWIPYMLKSKRVEATFVS